MKLSTKGRYGLKAMFELALDMSEKPVPLKVIAKKQDISEQYLEQIFSSLKKADLVKSVRGSQGGYFLSKNKAEITVGDVLRVLEGDFALTDCLSDNDSCKNSQSCVTKLVWEKMKNSIEIAMDSITLKDMVEDYKKTKINKKEDVMQVLNSK